MRKVNRGLVVLSVLTPTLIAAVALTSTMTLQPASRLWIRGTSTVRSFECKAGPLEAKVETAAPGATAALMGGEKAVTAASITIPAAQLDCRNGTMNEHMKKALKVKEHPTIEFRIASYTLAKASEGMRAELTGTLTLGGVEKPVTVQAIGKDEGDGTLRVTGTHEIRMTEYGLKPPTLMLGTMKVNERVNVGFDLLLKN
jgi:polyisoprenoid-binding protein YceI